MAYEHQEYPKWVCGQIVQDEDGEAAVLAAQPSPEPDDERKVIIAALTEKGVSFFKGATTEALKAKLAEQG